MKPGHLTLLFFALTACFSGIAKKGYAMDSIDQAQWSNRLILVAAQGDASAYAGALRKRKAGIDARHVLWFVVGANQTESNLGEKISGSLLASIARKFDENAPSRVLLIGKDGGVKLRSDELDVQRIFDLIDSMPMRIREMKSHP